MLATFFRAVKNSAFSGTHDSTFEIPSPFSKTELDEVIEVSKECGKTHREATTLVEDSVKVVLDVSDRKGISIIEGNIENAKFAIDRYRKHKRDMENVMKEATVFFIQLQHTHLMMLEAEAKQN